MIVLVGFMGAGKSTVGRLLARRLGLAFVDADALVEARAGKSIAEIFEEGDEATFRRLEADVCRQALQGDDAVVALGGGALENENTREALADATVVYLKVGLEEALQRIGDDKNRPMLRAGDVDALFAGRSNTYRRVAGLTLDTSGVSPEDVAERITDSFGERAAKTADRVRVEVDNEPYDVLIGSGIVPDAVASLPRDAEQIFLISHPELVPVSRPLSDALSRAGARVQVLEVPTGEASKSIREAERLHHLLAEAPAHRNDLVIAFGGGVIGDLAGFVASTYARGIRFAQMPTSLLAQVDAAIGGKTGVNLPQGKNLVGTFHQPVLVVCDVGLLRELPEAELRSGLAEVVKYGLISDPSLLDLLVSRAPEIYRREDEVLIEIVRRSVEIKASIVARDEKEHGIRAWLNYGHTLGHAIERQADGGLRHGEAVALGMMAAAYLAEETGRIDEEAVTLHRETLEAVGLPTRASLDFDALEAFWTRDKKYQKGVRFVLLRGIGRPEAGIPVDDDAIRRALKRMAG
jgi:3-dehydroquinate synthase